MSRPPLLILTLALAILAGVSLAYGWPLRCALSFVGAVWALAQAVPLAREKR